MTYKKVKELLERTDIKKEGYEETRETWERLIETLPRVEPWETQYQIKKCLEWDVPVRFIVESSTQIIIYLNNLILVLEKIEGSVGIALFTTDRNYTIKETFTKAYRTLYPIARKVLYLNDYIMVEYEENYE